MSRRVVTVGALNGVAALFYVLVGLASDLLQHVRDGAGYLSVYGAHDSVDYLAVASWIFGGPMPQAAIWRPFLYPLLLGLSERAGGTIGVWLLNVALWFAALNLAYAATRRFVRTTWLSAAVFVTLALNASLVVLTFKALTETLTVALLVLWAYGLSRMTTPPNAADVALTLLPAALLVLARPQFEVLLGVTAVVLGVGIVRSRERLRAGAVFVACLVPVAIQVALMLNFYGYFGVSQIGDRTIRDYYLSRLAVQIGQATDLRAAQPKMERISNGDAARLVVTHPYNAARLFAVTLGRNLISGSEMVREGAVQTYIRITNWIYLLGLIALVPLTVVALRRNRDGPLILLWIAMLNVYLAGGLTFYQGDRITIVAAPVLLIAFALAVDRSVPRGLNSGSKQT